MHDRSGLQPTGKIAVMQKCQKDNLVVATRTDSTSAARFTCLVGHVRIRRVGLRNVQAAGVKGHDSKIGEQQTS
jgi:hypothetical protein